MNFSTGQGFTRLPKMGNGTETKMRIPHRDRVGNSVSEHIVHPV